MNTVIMKSGKKAPVVSVSNFDINNFTLNREIPVLKRQGNEPDKSTQYLQFPKYTYNKGKTSGENNTKIEESKDPLALVTGTVRIGKGGLLRVDGNYRKTDDDCTSMWLPLDEEFGDKDAESLKEVLESIDEKVEKLNDKYKDGYFIVNPGKNEQTLKMNYTPLVREAEAPPGANDFVPYNRTKIKFPFKVIKDEDGKERNEINVKVQYVNDEGEKETAVCRSVTDLRNYLTFGSKVQLVLEFKTFWIAKMAKKKMNDCGFKVTCNMIKIIEKGKSAGGGDYGWDAFGDNDNDDEDDTSKKESKAPAKKPVKKVESEEESESESESEEESPKKPVKKPVKKPSKKEESESESDSESDSPKKPVKKGGKK